MLESPLLCDVHDKTMARVGRIADPVAISGVVRRNGLGAFEFRIRGTDPMAEDVLRKGCRIAIQYRGKPLYSGAVRTKQGSLLPNGDIVFQLQDDWRLLANTLALVAPTQAIKPTTMSATAASGWAQATLPGGSGTAGADGTIQGQLGHYTWPAGAPMSESAIKAIITANLVTRLGRAVTVKPDGARGGNASTAGMLPIVRMLNVAEAVLPILDWSGLVLRVVQPLGGSTVEVDVYEPQTWAAPLTVGSGVVPDGTWTLSPPAATRAFVGGPGEGAARAFWEMRDATGLEADYGDIIEVFRDATGAQLDWPASVAETYRVAKYYLLRPEVSAASKTALTNYLNAAGRKGLGEGLPTTGVQATLSETEDFYFGGADGIQLGDLVTVKDASGQVFADRITEAKFSLTSGGFTVEPVLGEKTNDPDRRLAQAVTALAASQRKLSASR